MPDSTTMPPTLFPRDWPRAWRALKILIADSDRTDQVFEIIDGLAGDSLENSYQRFIADPEGQRLLRERPSLLAALSDRAALAAMPAGSFGRAYLDCMEKGSLTADGLVEADEVAAKNLDKPPLADPDREFVGDRMRDMHDLWHVLTGYGMDEAGETANLAFSHAQIPNLGMGLIVGAGAVIGPKDLKFTWPRYLVAAWQRGRATSFLGVAPYEDLLPQPLEEVRAGLGIPPAEHVHPMGIAIATRDACGEDGVQWVS
ncbi:MAG: Coq4 family protein [Candidatus Binatia bacterium]|nr:Coq4 family protein [Candidatus Binatia bacterium]